jgi:hypothetical protein
MVRIDVWPTNRYLNIWVCNLSFLGINALLGYATPPIGAPNWHECNYNDNTCVDEPFDYPDMIENYMDYSDERCMNMFTQDQMNAMRYCLKNIRHELVDPNNAPVGIYENRENIRHLVKIFPNPVENNITIQNKGLKRNYILTISDLNSKACFNKWLNLNDFELITLDISFLNKGIYNINLKIT